MSLKQYNQKRDFKTTPEPEGRANRSEGRRFVIQKHAASRLHYDFRLEMAGTLKSWAVPKGIPYKKGEKHLAVEVEDHPVSYLHFEGTIPKGQYGGGTVMVWDLGNYEPLGAHPLKDLANGKLHFALRGKKLRGEWHLVKLRDGNNWLLIRAQDDMRPLPTKLEDTSALSGRTMEGIAMGNVVWNSNRTEDRPAGAKLRVDDVEVGVSNLDKVFYPKTGFTKGQVIDYYIRVSKVLLPHLKDRPITLKRYPDGVEGFFFYEKQCPSSRPKWVKTTRVPKSDGSQINYCVMNDLPALVWAANLADLELHTFLHKAPAVHRPTALAFDLDPGPPANIISCCEVALRLKAVFEALGLKSFPKTSGSKGMQIYVPLNTRVTYDQTKNFARELASFLEGRIPTLVVAKMQKSLRAGKVFVDWSQNGDTKTTVTVYSLRAKERPTVSTPLEWKEVERAFRKKDASALSFEAADVLQRVEKLGDVFSPVLSLKQKLPAAKFPSA